MMHIGFLTPEYPHPRVGQAAGIGTSIGNLTLSLAQRGIQVSVFVYGQKEDAVFTENGIRVHLMANKRGRFGWYFNRKRIGRYVQSAVDSDKIDVIEAPDWTGITAFMKFSVPLVLRFHGTDAYFCKLDGRRQKLKNFLFEKWAIRHADAFISPTDFASGLTKEIFGLQKEVRTIPNGISLSKFGNGNSDGYIEGKILYIGTLIRKKGVLELPLIMAKVLEKFPDAQLVLAGGDSPDQLSGGASTWEMIRNMAGSAVLDKISYVGKIPYADIEQLIQEAHVCVFPTFAETLGMVTIECMAMEKAVVSSDFGWVREIIDDGVNGFRVDPRDHGTFAGRITSLLSDRDLNKRLGKAAREKTAQKFEIETVTDQNIAFYQKLLKRQ